jgi:hypothetical protein
MELKKDLPELSGFLMKAHKMVLGPKQRRFCVVQDDAVSGTSFGYLFEFLSRLFFLAMWEFGIRENENLD